MWVRFPQGAPGQKRHLKGCLFCCLVPGIWLRQMPPPAGGTSARYARSMCGRNLRFPHTRPLPPLGGGLCAMRVCAANSLACQGLALTMLRFPLTLLFPSERLSLSDAEFAKGKLVWLVGAQSRQCPGRARSHLRARGLYPTPGLPTRGGGLHSASGTIVRHTRKPSPL